LREKSGGSLPVSGIFRYHEKRMVEGINAAGCRKLGQKVFNVMLCAPERTLAGAMNEESDS